MQKMHKIGTQGIDRNSECYEQLASKADSRLIDRLEQDANLL